ncbi:MAG: hypothetical protein GWN58_53025, partial [Anaerolineae bacterium]|nr:hypothetical protein [Anaerolineae bacterium]
MAVLILCWRHPRMAGLAALIVCLTFLISLIGSWAMGFLMLCLLAGLGWMVWQGTLPLWLMANAAVFLVLAVRQNR